MGVNKSGGTKIGGSVPSSQPVVQIDPGVHDKNAVVVEVHGRVVLEIWEEHDFLPKNKAVGSIAVADGLLYVMTEQGWKNVGEQLSQPPERTNRRGAIKAQKARKDEGFHQDAKA